MVRLEDLTAGTLVKGILPDALTELVTVKWHGSDVLEVVYKDTAGRIGTEILFRDREPALQALTAGRPWNFDGDGRLFRLVSEAHRIRLAHLFDPLLAVHTSLVEPLPHQITAVYEAMLPRQPLRFLLADDPGAGKTIMAGLFIKELLIRGDLQRCLIVAPGNLVEQWQDELWRKFNLPFEIATNDKLGAARTGNWFRENSLCIARLDKLSRNEDIQAKLKDTDWDLIVCDEAHKMSATFFGGEVRYTKRYHLGRLLGGLTRHFLLMTATPHNGKEEDFQLFMALLDADRFEGKFRDGVHTTDASDLMRRMVKERLLKFDGTPLFPERIAYTVNYSLSEGEKRLYKAVTEYVQEQFNLADQLSTEGRRGTVGFALTSLQRRLASSPEAIYQSLRRRRERLEKRLREERLLRSATSSTLGHAGPTLSPDEIEDLDDAPDAELAAETREGAVYQRLLDKLAEERDALGGQVFDVLGKVTFENRSLRELLMDAIRYGDQPDVRARLFQIVENALDRDKLRGLIEERALAHDSMDASIVRRIRESMERIEARRLQPHFIESYFLAAFKELGGTVREREPRRYEITYVPAALRHPWHRKIAFH